MKKAFITGISGQDAAYLAALLLNKNYKVFGGYSANSKRDFWRLKELGIQEDIELVEFDLLDFKKISNTFQQHCPDEVYNLAAQSSVGESFKNPLYTTEVDALGVVRLLEAIKLINPDSRFYQASTAEMFGRSDCIPQSETTPFSPCSPYGVSKLYAHWITVNYRESFNLHASSAILFNHESPLRGEEFVTRKITLGLSRIKYGLQDCLYLGNIETTRDWGFAGDYVEAMHLMLQQEKPEEYVIATGQAHTVKDFINAAAKICDFNLEWQGTGIDTTARDKKTNKVVLRIDPTFYRPTEVNYSLGDSSKAKIKLGWTPKLDFLDLVELMQLSDLRRTTKN